MVQVVVLPEYISKSPIPFPVFSPVLLPFSNSHSTLAIAQRGAPKMVSGGYSTTLYVPGYTLFVSFELGAMFILVGEYPGPGSGGSGGFQPPQSESQILASSSKPQSASPQSVASSIANGKTPESGSK